jgi:hypothetical protein
MTPFATHERWLLTDSEAMLDLEFVEAFRKEWAASGADTLTAGYRFTGLRSAAQTLDAAPPLLTLWPGLMLVRRVRFTLGACNGVNAADVRAIGGWETLAHELAEDQRLGAQLAEAGKKIRLSRHAVTLDSDPSGWGAFLRHQHRAAVTYRAAAPLGALGLPVLHTPVLALAAAGIHPAWWKWAALILAVRIVFAAIISRRLRFRLPLLPVAVVLSAFVESAMWLAAWVSPCVWWSGRWRKIGWRGAMTGRALHVR